MFRPIPLIVFFVLISNIGKSQEVILLSYSPEYPSLTDTITVQYGIKYNNFACVQDSVHVEKLIYGQYQASSYTCCSGAGPTAFYEMYDTIRIFPNYFVPGYIDVYFEVGYLTDASCPGFPILVGGDTISYPTHIDYIEIPVGFVASVSEVPNDISIFPNPVNTELNINFLNSGVNYDKGVLYDMSGKAIKMISVNSEDIQVDCSEIPNGVYLLELVSNQSSVKRKIIIQHN